MRPNDTVVVSHLASLNSLVMQVQAYDNDAGENKTLVFSISDRNDSDIFGINSRTGEIIVAKQLQGGLMDRYYLRIAVSDQGPKPLTSHETLHLVVAVKNSTDVTPQHRADSPDYNIAIVITVIVVTLVLSATILVTIFVIRRLDMQKRKYAEEVAANGPKPGGKPLTNMCIESQQYSAPGERVGMFYTGSDTSHDRISVNSQSTFQVCMTSVPQLLCNRILVFFDYFINSIAVLVYGFVMPTCLSVNLLIVLRSLVVRLCLAYHTTGWRSDLPSCIILVEFLYEKSIHNRIISII